MNRIFLPALAATLLWGCQQRQQDLPVKAFEPEEAARMAAAIEAGIKPELDSGLTLKLWAFDSLVVSPISIDVDDYGRLFFTTTDRQKHSEFDIRGHRDWEIPSIALQTVEDRRNFLRNELSPENSARNTWLADLNGDGSHDWRDLTVEKEKDYRVEDTDGDGIADRSQLIVHDFHEEVTDVAGGVFADGDDLYVAVAPDLWKMVDKNGDGIPDEKTSLSHGYGIHIGFSGHGMSGVKMGPDGRLYWQIGDIGFNGTGPDGQRWEYPNCGVIARCNPDGSDFEIFAYGLRNTHQFVFDEYGNIISEDNDGDHPGERERLVYIVNGSDAGWRSNWQYGKYRDPNNNTYKVWMDERMYLPRHEEQAAYITPCIANFVSGPTGLVYNPGTALSPAFKNTFLVVEFVGSPANSGIHSFKLNPKGATFELGEHKKILGGILPTGLDFGPDGALYIADWIDGWGTHDYGRVWKMDHEDRTFEAIRREVQSLLAEDFGKRSDSDLNNLLRHDDMRIRQKAQFALARRGDKGLETFRQALSGDHQLARIHAIWGISQLARKKAAHAEALLPLLKDADAEIRAQAAKWLGDIRYANAGDQLIPLLADTNARVRFFAAEALGRIGHEPAVGPIIAMLEANNDEDAYLRHAGALALARIGKAEPIAALAEHPSRALRIAAVVALRRMAHADVAHFLNDKDEFVVTEAARAINDDLSIEPALPALGNLLNETSFTNEALIRRAINANLRVGKPENLENLIRYAQNRRNPVAMRAEALDALSTWAKPSVVDRVDGRYRGVIERDAEALKTHTASAFIGLLAEPELSVRLSAAKGLGKLRIGEGAGPLLDVLKADREVVVREAALRALVALEDPKQEEAIRLALTDREKAVRVAALDLLESMAIADQVKVDLLADIIASKTTEEKQAAIIALGKLPVEQSSGVFGRLLDQMENGTLPKEVYLELGEAIDRTHTDALIARFRAISSQTSDDELMAAYASTLQGGNPQRGRGIFFQHSGAQCMRCHAYDDRGGNAGPRLNGIGARLTREQLLEALIDPSRRIAPGFGVVILELNDGESVSGIYQGEDTRGVRLRKGQEDQMIPHNRIAKKTFSPSSMTDMKGVLSAREIRDVVAFLATLTEE